MNTMGTLSTKRALDIFKTLVRLRVVDHIVHPYEWTVWYYGVKEFVGKYGK